MMQNDYELQIVKNGWLVRRRIIRKGEPHGFETWVARTNEEIISIITTQSGEQND